MTRAEALFQFLQKARLLVTQLEAVQPDEDKLMYCNNAEIALRNVRSRLARAEDGTLPGSYGTSGFGISKSDLMFGRAEDALYELERLYLQYLT
jgi:hypothetical protein